MDGRLPWRKFLQAAQAAGGLMAYSAQEAGESQRRGTGEAQSRRHRDIGHAILTLPDYPIQPKAYWEIAMKDGFWKPKIDLNARVTIPFEVKKLSESGARGFNGGVLEASILSLKLTRTSGCKRKWTHVSQR